MSQSREVIAAVDIGGTKIAVGLVDRDGHILEREAGPSQPDRDLEDGLLRIQSMLRACQQRRPEAIVQGVGIGCTGPVDPETGVLGPNSFLPLWEGQAMRARVESLFGLPAAIENDADAAALGESAWGAGRGAARFLYVTVSTGIGCGVVLDGRLYRGVEGAHPEMGHHVIDSSGGPPCFCGARGCWESLASGPALANWFLSTAIERGLPAPAGLTAREICQMAVNGDPLAGEAVRREAFYLGTGLANLITLFTPDVIALGGGLMDSWPLFEEGVRAVIRQNSGLVPYQKTRLLPASLGSRTGLAGAAQVWFHRFGG
jgi:glucokinase